MMPAQKQLARKRLRLGVCNVGFWVVMAGLGLWLIGSVHLSALETGLLFLAAVSVQAGFDWVGGALLMPAPRPGLEVFLRRWGRGVCVHTGLMVAMGALSLASLRFTSGFGAAVFVGMLGLALIRKRLLAIFTGSAAWEYPGIGGQMWVAATGDPSFTGGIVGLGKQAQGLFPSAWLETLSAADTALELRRRTWQIAQALPRRDFLLALGWNLAGAGLGGWFFGWAQRSPAEALFGHACWMTLWTFLSLLVFPGLSRGSVFAADRALAAEKLDPAPWIQQFAGLIGEDGSEDSVLQTIFYPIPSTERRLEALQQRGAGVGLGNLARNHLFYSWAGFTLLGRAVHCNVGRPALWVFPPSA
jgi:hypothetical protein